MTKRAQKRLTALLAPRRPRRWAAVESDYSRHVLDSTKQELHPQSRYGLIDRPGVPADDPFMDPAKSELDQILTLLIDAALTQQPGLRSDDEDPLVLMAAAAGLTLAEYEAVAMRTDGSSWKEIARRQRVSEVAARQAGRRARLKLQADLLRQGLFTEVSI